MSETAVNEKKPLDEIVYDQVEKASEMTGVRHNRGSSEEILASINYNLTIQNAILHHNMKLMDDKLKKLETVLWGINNSIKNK